MHLIRLLHVRTKVKPKKIKHLRIKLNKKHAFIRLFPVESISNSTLQDFNFRGYYCFSGQTSKKLLK